MGITGYIYALFNFVTEMRKQEMKPVIVLSICLFASLFAYGQTAPLTLEQCLEIALSDNPTVKIADKEVERVDYSKKSTLAQLLPQASFTGSYNRMLAKQVAYMNMVGFGDMFGGEGEEGDGTDTPTAPGTSSGSADDQGKGKDNGIKMGLDNSYQVGFSASLPLIAPQLWASLKLSDSQILQAVEEARSSRLNLINQVKNAYYALLLAEDSRKVIQESYDMAALTHDMYTKQYQAGAASDYDVLRTSVAVKNIEPELLQADIAIKQARLQLLILMGLDATSDITAAGRLSDFEATMYEQTLAIDPDYTNNSSLVLNDIQTKQLSQALSVQKASLYPTLSASASYSWTSSSNGNPLRNFRWNPYSMVGLTLNVPILTGGKRYADIKQAQIQLDEMHWQRDNLERTVSMQVTMAIDNIRINVEQISSCSESVKQATRAHDIMEKSFAIGASSYLDLRDSELSLTQSRLAYNQAIYNYLVAHSDLELLLGNAVKRGA